MKYLLSFSIAIFFIFINCKSKSIEPLQADIDAIVKHWLPDKRVGICNFNLVPTNKSEVVIKGESLYPGSKAEVLDFLRGKGISIIDSVVILPDTVRFEKNWGLVTLSVANMRTKPAHSSEMVSQAILGTPVRILKEIEGWTLIQTPDLYIGWTNRSAIHPMTRSDINEWRSSERLIYTGTDGSIKGENPDNTIISDLVAGALVVKKSVSSKFAVIALPDGRTGVIQKVNWTDFNKWKDTVSLKTDLMISTGKKFMGFPYLWGGTSSKGMDCSGFVKTVCFLNGVILERDASQQVNHGTEVDLSGGTGKLIKGDLLFFGSRQPYRVNHVGLYIGNSEVLHESGSVHINSLEKGKSNYNEELASNLVAARRIIGKLPEKGYWPLKNHNWY